MTRRARLTDHTAHLFTLHSTYDRQFVEDLKTTIHYSDRSWDKGNLCWLISKYCKQAVLALLGTHGYSVEDLSQDASPVAPMGEAEIPEDLARAFATLYLAPSCPLKAAEIMYKGLSRLVHPDVGGNIHAFYAINDAIDTIRKHLA